MIDLQYYKNLIKNQATEIDYKGEKHYIKLSETLDLDLINVIKDKDLDETVRRSKMLASLICDEDGLRVFDANNDEHLKLVLNLPEALQIIMINKFQEFFFSKKKSPEAPKK